MWKTACQQCGWESGGAYLRSVAETIGKLHEEDQAGHKVVMMEVSTFGTGVEEEENSGSQKPGSSKP